MTCPKCQCQECLYERTKQFSQVPPPEKPKCPLCRGTGNAQDAFGFYPCVCVKYGPRTG